MKIAMILLLLNFSVKAFSYEEIIQSFEVSSKHINVSKIVDQFEIKSHHNNHLLVYVLKEDVKKFLLLAPKAKLKSKDINSFLKKQSLLINNYHTYKDVRDEMNEYLNRYPELTSLVEYGKSENQNPLFALKLTSKTKNLKNKLMITSATHGDELITVEVTLGLMDLLLKGHKKSPRFQRFLDHNEIFFIPVVNPDGFKKRSRYAHRIDPNRAYPMPNGERRTRRTVKCIEELIKFYNKVNFHGSIDFHASGEMIMFPWAFTKKKIQAADFQLFDQLTTNMSKLNNYKHGQISKVIYVAKGSSVDYYYSKNRAIALGIELTTSKYPKASKIKSIVKDASEMTWQFIENFSL